MSSLGIPGLIDDIGAGSATPAAPRNGLLRLLPAEDWHRLRANFRLVELKPRQVLHHWRMPMQHVYFIESGLVSTAAWLGNDLFVEVWLIGSEGMTGLPIILGDRDDPPHRRVVQVGGRAWRVSVNDLTRSMEEVPSLRSILLRYVQIVLMQTSQVGACNAHHEIKQRVARWLLQARDALQSHDLPLTHEVLGRLLGIRRASVSECLGVLESERGIELRRGLIQIIDSGQLERTACACYRIIRREHRRLLIRETSREATFALPAAIHEAPCHNTPEVG